MNKARPFLLVMLALGSVAAARPQAPHAEEKTFRGEIADTQCALNVHSLSRSHKEMMGMKPELNTSEDCVRFCIKERGGKLVLQSRDKVYRLDKPEEAEPFAGQQVKITGTLDPKTNTITVRDIVPVTANPSISVHPQ
jgi:Protein of unknown function (DUF5818)